MPRRRSNLIFEDRDNRPSKSSRVDGKQPIEALSSANARISDLEQQIKNLHAFLNVTGMISPTLRTFLLVEIKAGALRVYEELYEATCNARKSGVTSDDISQAMVEFRDEVEDLRKLSVSVIVAFDLVIFLAAHSYGELDGKGCGYGDRPSDEYIDKLLCELASERREVDPPWGFAKALEMLQGHAEELSMGNFCSSTVELLSAWKDALPTDAQLCSSKEASHRPTVHNVAEITNRSEKP